MLLEVLIFATGNYNFFNVLTIVLCVAMLDDRWTKPIVRGVATRPGRRLCKTLAACIMALGILVTLHAVFRASRARRRPHPGSRTPAPRQPVWPVSPS